MSVNMSENWAVQPSCIVNELEKDNTYYIHILESV